MAGIEFREVAERVSCETFARQHMEIRGNRARCPFHGGEHFNLAFTADGHAYCHVCHRAADVVQLAAAVWMTDQANAARQLNDEYGLNLSDQMPTETERAQRKAAEARRKEDQQRERRQWAAACDAEQAAAAAAERFSASDAEKPAFQDAARRLVAARLRVDVLEMERGGRGA